MAYIVIQLYAGQRSICIFLTFLSTPMKDGSQQTAVYDKSQLRVFSFEDVYLIFETYLTLIRWKFNAEFLFYLPAVRYTCLLACQLRRYCIGLGWAAHTLCNHVFWVNCQSGIMRHVLCSRVTAAYAYTRINRYCSCAHCHRHYCYVLLLNLVLIDQTIVDFLHRDVIQIGRFDNYNLWSSPPKEKLYIL